MIKFKRSPISYMGNKFSMLPHLTPLFPEKIDTFVELFGGSGVVSYNTPARRYIYNDRIPFLSKVFALWREQPTEDSLANLRNIVAEHSLTKEDKSAFEVYKKYCNSLLKEIGEIPVEHLFILMCFSFNNQMRYNKSGEYNMPFGNRGAYISETDGIVEKKLISFSEFVKTSDIEFHCADFTDIEIPDGSFVYLDPPYLVSKAVYQEKGEYTVEDDLRLMEYCDQLTARGVKFGMSNLLASREKQNIILKDWAEARGYTIHYIDKDYSRCNYQRKNRGHDVEVYICNY